MGRTREKGGRGTGSGSRGSLCLAHPTVLPSSCLVPSPPPTGRRPVGEWVATPAERKEGWAEREGRLRRGVDLAEGWAGGTQGSWAPRPQCSGVDPRLLPLRACPQPLGAEDGVLRSQRGAWLDPSLLYRVSSRILGRDWGGGHPEASRCYKYSLLPPQMFYPQQDPWQGRQPLPPHPAGQKSLNSGLRKVFVQLVTQGSPQYRAPRPAPLHGGSRRQGGRGPRPKLDFHAPHLGQRGCLRWEEDWKGEKEGWDCFPRSQLQEEGASTFGGRGG